MKALATLALLFGPFLAHGQEQAEATAADAAPVANSIDDSGVFSERPAPGVGVSDADINIAGEADSTGRR